MADFDRTAESEWVRLAREGDDQAFANLVEAFQGPVFNLCYRMLGDPVDAEDAAQESFLRAHQNLRRYDPERKFATWMLSIASHYCIDRLRRRRLKLIPLEDVKHRHDGANPGLGPEDRFVRLEMREQVKSMLDTLSAVDRAALILLYWYDYSYEEIGETLSLSVSAVKSRLHRARKELAQGLLPAAEGVLQGGLQNGPSAV